jgi:hypothetical protein
MPPITKWEFSKEIDDLFIRKGWKDNELRPSASPSLIQKIRNQNYSPSFRKLGEIIEALKKQGVSVDSQRLSDSLRLQKARGAQPKKLPSLNLAGVYRVSTGTERTEAYRQLALKAQRRLVIMGIGMTNISKYALDSLEKHASRVPIDLLMIDPDVLESEPDFAKKLEGFLGIPGFTAEARQSCNRLTEFCSKWNLQRKQKNKIHFRVYDTIPTMSMVMIDPKGETGEIELEFFLYQSGEFRPRFAIKKVEHNESLFALLYQKFERLWKRSRRII